MNPLPLTPSRSEFRDLAAKGNLIPVCTEFVADYETPIAAFEKIDNGFRSFLFESAESNDHVGRYSFLGSDPLIYFEARGRPPYKIRRVVQHRTLPRRRASRRW